MKIYDNLQQGTNEWLEVRSGKFTGSDFHTLIGNSETKKKILFKKSIERLTKTTIIEEITSPDIERGKEEEKPCFSRLESRFVCHKKTTISCVFPVFKRKNI